jgi:Fe-S-cluster-containing hydrogenase component 2
MPTSSDGQVRGLDFSGHAIALSGPQRRPVLDPSRCIACSCCHEICPKDAIRMSQSRILRWLKVFKGID